MDKFFKQLDSPELRNSFLFLWGFAFCVFGFVVSFNLPDNMVMQGAQFPIAIFGFVFFVEALRSFYKSLKYLESDVEKPDAWKRQIKQEKPLTAPVIDEAEEAEPEIEESEEDHEKVDFYDFIYGVTVRNLVSERKWADLPREDELARIGRSHFRAWIGLLEKAGIVSAVAEGGRRKVLKTNFQDALDAMEGYVLRTDGITNYWKAIQDNYHVKINSPGVKSPIEEKTA